MKSNRLLLMYLFWLCYVLAGEETATDEYRFGLQSFCNFSSDLFIYELLLEEKPVFKLNNNMTVR